MPGQSPILGLHHVAIATRDVDAAARFHTEAVSFTPWPAAQALRLPGEGRMLACANAGLRLIEADPSAVVMRRPVNEAGIAHLCLQTPDITLVHRRFAEAGASFHSEPIDLGTGFLYCYARDPEFNVIEIECVPPVWPDPKPWLAHANIVTHDLPRLTDFYACWLQADAVRSPRLRDDVRLDTIADLTGVQVRAAWLQAGNLQLELMQYLQPATSQQSTRRALSATQPIGHAYLAFEVADLTEAMAHLQARGGTPAAATNAGDDNDCARAHDPDGNRIMLLRLDAPSRRQASLQALAEPGITHRFSATRAALLQNP